MKCEVCGMNITEQPVVEELDGKNYYYCCNGCLETGICKRDKPLRNLQKNNRIE